MDIKNLSPEEQMDLFRKGHAEVERFLGPASQQIEKAKGLAQKARERGETELAEEIDEGIKQFQQEIRAIIYKIIKDQKAELTKQGYKWEDIEELVDNTMKRLNLRD